MTTLNLRKPLLVATATFVVLGLADWGLGAAMGDDHPTIEQTKGKKNQTAIVVFGGMQASTKTLIAPHRQLLLQYGDLVTVENSQTGFDGSVVVVDTHKKLTEWGYKRAIILGVSQGGPVGTDLIDYDRANGHKLQFSMIAADAYTDADDIESWLGLQVMSRWHAGWLSDLALTKLVWWAAFDPPGKDELGKGVDPKLLDEHYNVSKNYALSGWTDELRFARDHIGYRPDAYKGVPLHVLVSENDDVVKKEAAKRWQLAFGGGNVTTVPRSRHAGLVEWPREWNDGLERALNKVA